ncbi:ATP-binding protein [Parafilimonas sp.]|uniref:DNA polymerase III subunit n=1 Tax=Parafilimonas sp. TaxID=1969739 RepID=UPI0039E4A2CB
MLPNIFHPHPYLRFMLFADIIGQQPTKRHLLEMVEQNRLSHALLFLGKEGSGALPLALAFAAYISLLPNSTTGGGREEVSLFGEAENVKPAFPKTPEAADAFMQKQPGFSKARNYIHPDIHFSYPVIPKKSGDKPVSTDYAEEWREFIGQMPYGNVYDWLQFIGAENKQGNITAEECNDIIRKLSLKSFESGHKVLIMWMPEYLGKEGNKLLKLIEEPPANTLFILVAENEDLILPTILSRCQLVKINAPDTSDIAGALVKRGNIEMVAAQQTAAISQGNYREALQLLQNASEDWQSLLREWLNAILKNGPAAQVKWIEEISKLGREKQKQFLLYFMHLLQQSIRLCFAGDNPPVSIADSEKDFAERLNKFAPVNHQQAIIEELNKAIYYIERNANAKMLFHALTIKLYHLIRNNALILTP